MMNVNVFLIGFQGGSSIISSVMRVRLTGVITTGGRGYGETEGGGRGGG